MDKKLTNIHKLKAFEFRYQGNSYKQIAEKVNYRTETLKQYFSKKWKKEFAGYCETMNEIRDEEAKTVLAGNIANASKTIVKELLSDDPKVRLRAANDILNRRWGKPKETVKQEFDDKVTEVEVKIVRNETEAGSD